jgi:hypothetical protein
VLGWATPHRCSSARCQYNVTKQQNDKAAEQPSDRTTRHYELNSKLSNIHVGKLPKNFETTTHASPLE